MVNTEVVDVVVGCMIVDDFVEMQLDPLQLEGVAGCGSGVTLTAEFGSRKALWSFAVARLKDLLTAEASLWTK